MITLLKTKLSRWRHFVAITLRMLQLRLMRNESNRLLAKQAIAGHLGHLGGISMKIGQVVADVGNGKELRTLLDGDRGRPLAEMLPTLAEALDQSVDKVFSDIEESVNAASLGQVHKARLHNGETVAIKIQYPQIAEAVNSELKVAGLVPGLGPVKKWGMDLNAYKKSLADNMDRELDYESEAYRQQWMSDRLNVEGLVVPKVYVNYSNRQVLVQSWESGQLLDQILDWPKLDRMLVGRCLLSTLFQCVFKLGQVHGDPHMGNFYFRRNVSGKPEVVQMDYGCTIDVSENARLALLQLIIRLRDGNQQSLLANFATMGFDPAKLVYIERELPLLAQTLFKPFLDDMPFEPENWRIKSSFDQLLGEKKWWFRSAGPANLFLLMRAFQGVVRQMQRLQVKLPWWPLLNQAVGEEVIEAARCFQAPALTGDLPATVSSLQPVARSLRILVANAGETLVDMSMPALAALELEEIIPTDIRHKVSATINFNFKQLRDELIETQFTPRDIIVLNNGAKSYRIWLE